MSGDERRTKDMTDDDRPNQELHQVQLERPSQLADADAGTKTFHMAPRQELGWPEGYDRGDNWPVYDPFTGLRTAAVLGGLMLLVLVYILYKTRCGGRIGRRRWTSKDRLFVERYKRKVQERCTLDASARHRRRELTRGQAYNVDAASTTDKQGHILSSADLRLPSQKDADRRNRRRHHSVNEAIAHLDVPLHIGHGVGRRDNSCVARPTVTTPALAAQERPQPVVVIVEDRQSADELDGKTRPLLPSGVPLADVAARRTGRAKLLVHNTVLRRFGRRCRSLDNVLNGIGYTAVPRTTALPVNAN